MSWPSDDSLGVFIQAVQGITTPESDPRPNDNRARSAKQPDLESRRPSAVHRNRLHVFRRLDETLHHNS